VATMSCRPCRTRRPDDDMQMARGFLQQLLHATSAPATAHWSTVEMSVVAIT
jgi:hypothetical protein